jgi:hypothetical protein
MGVAETQRVSKTEKNKQMDNIKKDYDENIVGVF